jgi:hypothetical protein
MNESVYLSTAYLGPVQYYSKLYRYGVAYVEAVENYIKQSYRNRCVIASPNGPLALSVPIVKPDTLKCLTKDIRISEHGNWRHLHWNALVSAYNMSPFFEYYADDFAHFYEKRFEFLFDYNEELRRLVCELMDIQPNVRFTEEYLPIVDNDFRETIGPKSKVEDADFVSKPYHQVFQEKLGFLPNLSIVDLLFNKGPESVLWL